MPHYHHGQSTYHWTPERQHQAERSTRRIYEQSDKPILPALAGPTPLSLMGVQGLAPPASLPQPPPPPPRPSSLSCGMAGADAAASAATVAAAGGVQTLMALAGRGAMAAAQSRAMRLARERSEQGGAR
ncbi:hypothetical protein HK405_003881 [Cladochytrium tenue]|nr:hypothetical protein HK405_003881 [Cladochytrium tenue]